MAAGQLFSLAPYKRRRARQAAAHGTATLAGRVCGGSGDGPNRPVRPNGPTQQLGWRRVLGQNQESE
jgi:hypothetical protein